MDSTGALFQISDVLIFGLAHPTECGAKTDTNAVLRTLAGIVQARVVECQLRRGDSELRIAVEPLQAVWREEFFRIPIADLAGATHVKGAGIETGDGADAALLGQNSIPKVFATAPDASDGPDPSDDSASSAHTVTLFAFASTYAFMSRNVLFAM